MSEVFTAKSIGKGISKIEEDFILCEEPLSRLVFQAQIHNNGIRGKIVRQRRESKNDVWIPDEAIDIRKLGKKEFINIELNTESISNFYEGIQKLAAILKQHGVEYGENKYAVSDPNSLIITDENKAAFIKKILEAGHSEEVWANLAEINPSLVTKLSYARIHTDRKESIDTFSKNICDEQKNEPYWQDFLKKNQWIFGFSLDYKFKGVLQKEALVSDPNIDRTEAVIGDYLLGDKNFVTFVELKKPTEKIFLSTKNRASAWKISNVLFDSCSQVLEQKASGLIKFDKEQFDENGNRIIQKAYDSKVILIYGNLREELANDNDKDKEIKLKTFELFRRDTRNIEILTYDELLERATRMLEKI